MDKLRNFLGPKQGENTTNNTKITPREGNHLRRTRSSDNLVSPSPRKGMRIASLRKRQTNSKLIENFELSLSPKLATIQEKSKWTVPGVIKQFKTGKITLKFLATVKQLIQSAQECSDEFIKQEGFLILIDLPEKNDYKLKHGQIKMMIVEIFCSCISSPKLFEQILDQPQMLFTLTTWAREPEIKPMVYYLLAVLPYFVDDNQLAEEAYNVVITALEFYQYKYNETSRFQHLVMALQFEKSDKLVLSILALINMLVNLPEALEDRLSMRAEFRALGIEEVFNKILDSESLDTDDIWDIIKAWKSDALDDEEDYDDQIFELTQQTTQDSSYLDMLDKRVPKHLRRAYDEIIKRMIFMPTDSNAGLQKWLLLERVLRQLTNTDAEQVTFDNKVWINVDELLKPLAQEATAEKQNYKMFEDKTKLEHEITKFEKQLVVQKKLVQDKEKILAEKEKEIESLKSDKQKQAKEAAEVIVNTKEDLRMAEDEKKEVEAKFKNMTADQKKFANDMIAKLQRERGRARNSEMALAELKRELLKVQQEREEEKLFLSSKIRSEMEAEKKEAIYEAKKEVKEEKERLEKIIGEKFQKEIESLKNSLSKSTTELNEAHSKELADKLASQKAHFEAIINTESEMARQKLETVEMQLFESEQIISKKDADMADLTSHLESLKATLVNQEKMFEKKLETKTDFLNALKEQGDELNSLLDTQTSLANKAKLQAMEAEKQLVATNQKLEVVRIAFDQQKKVVKDIENERDQNKQKVTELEAQITSIKKNSGDVDKIVEQKNAEINRLKKEMDNLIANGACLADGPVLRNIGGPQEPSNALPPKVTGPPPPPLPDFSHFTFDDAPPPSSAGPPPPGGPPPPPGPPAPPGPPPPPGPPGGPPPPPSSGGPPPPPPGRGPPPAPGGGRGPPGRGGPPLPPPMTRGPTGPKPSPGIKMKNFHWSKLRGNQVETTLFKDLKPTAIKLDVPALEKLFCVKTNEKEGGVAEKKKIQAPPKVSHVNPKLLQSVGIFLKQVQNSKEMKAMLSEKDIHFNKLIKDSILQNNTNVLDVDRIQGLIQGAPEQSELQMIQEWVANPENTLDKLNEVDCFFLEISAIPQYVQRLKCWRFILKYKEDNSAIEVELLKIRKGLICINNSKHFLKVLEVVLAVGNFMNHGTRTGNTVGFDISVLVKLGETRANESSAGSLLDFIITTLESFYPDTMAWTDELEDLKYAKVASWDKIDILIKELKASLTVVKGLVAGITLLPEPTVDLFNNIKESITKAEEEFDETKILYDAVVDDWNSLAKLYAKDSTKVKPEQFFVSIYEFVEKFKNSLIEREKRVKELEKKRKTEEAQNEIKKRKDEIQKKKEALGINEKKKENEEEVEAQENLSGMLKSLAAGQKERRETRTTTREKGQVSASSQEADPNANATATAPPPVAVTSTESRAESNRDDEKAARRAALQAKQRARRAALEAAKNSENQPDQ